jgi:glycosyltransferase involved in cell wall biosynthesis
MRFLMLSWRDPHNPKAGGAERVSQAYLAALKQRGHEVFWFSNAFPGCVSSEVIDGIQIVRGGGQGTSIVKAIQWYRQQPHFDLVVDQHHGIPWFAPWWCRTHCVAYLHEVLGPIWSAFYSWPVCVLGQWQERVVHWLYRHKPFWVGSESTRRALLSRGVRNVTVIHYGISLQPPAELEPKPIQEPLHLIAVSRLAPNKRIDHAIRALQLLTARGLDARLTIVGSGEAESALRSLSRQLQLDGKVNFTGQLSETAKDALLRRSHLLVHNSLREGWGLNVLEANALGTPAVVYPVDGLVDAVVQGQTGIVTRDETPESVADAIGGLLKRPDLYQQFRLNARARTESFHWSRVLPTACEQLEKWAAGKGTNGG